MNSTRINQGRFRHIAVLLIGLHSPMLVRAQLVADGQTNILNNVITNISGNVTVGTNGDFTLLVLTNGTKMSNATDDSVLAIGANASAQSNRLVITDPGTVLAAIDKNIYSVGESGSANELDILNGGKAINGLSYIGQNATGSNNLVLVSGAGSIWSNLNLYVGDAGAGNALVITNGGRVFTIFPASISVIGNSVSSSNNCATVTGAGSIWTNGGFVVGTNSSRMNQLNIANGASFGSAVLSVGAGADSNTITVTGAGSVLNCYGILVGSNGVGNQCVVSNGSALYAGQAGWPTIIQGTASSAIITGAGSTWSNTVDITFGQYSNLLSITDGGSLLDRNGLVRLSPGVFGNTAPDTIVIAGQNSIWNNRGLFSVAEQGLQLFITNGGTLVDGSGYLGDLYSLTGSIGTFAHAVVSGNGSLWSSRSNLYIGYVGVSNQVLVTDSGALTASNLWVGGNIGQRNQLVVSNSGTVTVSNQLFIGSASQFNAVSNYGGTILVSNGASLTNGGTLALYSGVFEAGSLLTSTDTFTKVIFKGGTLQVGGTSYGSPSAFAIGGGTNAAVFQMVNNGTHTFSDGMVISNNGVLTGLGTITGNISVNSGGTIAPGNGNIGTIVATGGLTLNSGSTAFMKLNALAGTADSITGVSNLVYSGTLQLTNLAGSFSAGKSFKLFDAANYTGAFGGLSPLSPAAGLRWDTNELGVDGVLRVFSSIPQPPSFAGVTVANGNLVVSAVGGNPYDPCYLLTSTNLSAPVSGWTYIATNTFDLSGAVSFTNAISAGQAQQYFRLQVN